MVTFSVNGFDRLILGIVQLCTVSWKTTSDGKVWISPGGNLNPFYFSLPGHEPASSHKVHCVMGFYRLELQMSSLNYSIAMIDSTVHLWLTFPYDFRTSRRIFLSNSAKVKKPVTRI